MIELIKIAISLAPVFVLLAALVVLDSYKLVAKGVVFQTILAGCLAAIVCLLANQWLLGVAGIDKSAYSRYIAPLIEESIKAAYLFFLLRSKRVGFMVDAAIYGFSIGAGFALVENIYYLLNLESTNMLVWVIRGFGTAGLHAATMAIFGIVSKSIADRYTRERLLYFLPGFGIAVATHSLFNHFIFSPLLTTLMLLVFLPLLLLVIFDRSERMTRDWLGVGFDVDQELLRILTAGKISESKIGRYLTSLQDRFPGQVVADMFCLLRIHTELALAAKGTLMMQQAGIKVPPDPETTAKFAEMEYLKKSIGKTGKLAILPFLHTSSRELWQLRKIKA